MPSEAAVSGAALAEAAATVLERLRARSPRVHALTSPVALQRTADVLIAIGAVPTLTMDADEVARVAGGADALLINLGMLDANRRLAAPRAMAAAAGLPVVLDPVFIDRDPERRAFALQLASGATLVKTNAVEAARLLHGPEPATAAALARQLGRPVAITGAVDAVSDGARSVAVGNGHALLAQLTATGCAAGAVIAAAMAVEPDPVLAAAAALGIVGVAAEAAAPLAGGPGTFAGLWHDALAALLPEHLAAVLRISQGEP